MVRNYFLMFITLFIYVEQAQAMFPALRSLYLKQRVKTHNKQYARELSNQKHQKEKRGAHQKTVSSLLKIKERYEKNGKDIPSSKLKKRIERISKIEAKQRDYALALYALSFIGGVYAIKDTVDYIIEEYINKNDIEHMILEKSYDQFLEILFSDSKIDINEQCQNLIGMNFTQLEQFFEHEVGISLKEVVITTISKKLHGQSIEDTLTAFQKELRTNKDVKQQFLNVASKLLYPTVSQRAPAFVNFAQLTNYLSMNYATSLYEYAISSEFIPFIAQLEKNIDTDLERFNPIKHAAIHVSGNIILIPLSSLVTTSLFEIGALRTACLLPAIGIPLDLALRCKNKRLRPLLHKMIENVQVDFDPVINKDELPINQLDNNPHYYNVVPFIRNVYKNYVVSNDFVGTITAQDLPSCVIQDALHHELENTKNNFENVSLPLIKKTISQVFDK